MDCWIGIKAVSYTHLDVYKRQHVYDAQDADEDLRGSTPTFTKETSISAVNIRPNSCRRHDPDDDADYKDSQDGHPRTRLLRPIVKVTR